MVFEAGQFQSKSEVFVKASNKSPAVITVAEILTISTNFILFVHMLRCVI